MLLTPVKREEFNFSTRKIGDNMALVEEFISSNEDVAEVTNYTHKTPYSCATSLRQTCATMKVGVTAIVRDGKVYLCRQEVIK